MRNIKGILLTILLTGGLLFFYYSYFIINADNLTYGQWGDGYKNYYTLAYYLRYDSGAHFTGMDYPFGENVIFTDNQPAFAWLLKAVSFVYPGISYHIHAFEALAIFLSIVIAAIFVFLILRKCGVNELFSAVFASLIAMLSPQLERLMHGHFSLGYSFFVPALIYLLVRLLSGSRAKIVLPLIAGLLTFFGFVHLYLMAMGSMFVLLLIITLAISDLKKAKQEWKTYSAMLFVALLPFAIVKSYLLLTDHINDRPKAPWGFISSRSTVADILTHPYSFTGELIAKILPPGKLVYHAEGVGYIGFVTVLCLAIALIVGLIQLARYRKVIFAQTALSYLIIPATLVLLFAMAFPFSIDPLEKYYNLLPAFAKQFRASGRFNWVFYYTATIFSVTLIYQLFLKVKSIKPAAAYLLIAASIMVWFADVNMVSLRYAKSFHREACLLDENGQTKTLKSELGKINKSPGDFQAIMPVPFFLNGSEKIYIESGMIFDAMKTSLYLHLPIVCGQMSRTSISQTLKMLNLVSNEMIKKEIINLYPNNKPLLLVSGDRDLSKIELGLISRAKYLFRFDNCNFYELPLSAFDDSLSAVRNNYLASKNNYFEHAAYSSTDSLNTVFYNNFDGENGTFALFGKALYNPKNSKTLFFDTLPSAVAASPYELSVWLYADDRVCSFPVMYLNQVDSAGKEVEKQDMLGKFSTNSYGKWIRVNFNFTLQNRKNKIGLYGDGDFASYDELMVRPINTNVVTNYQSDSSFVFNNYPVH